MMMLVFCPVWVIIVCGMFLCGSFGAFFLNLRNPSGSCQLCVQGQQRHVTIT